MLTEGNTMQYIDDFCENTQFNNNHHLTDQTVSKLFASLTNHEQLTFFKEWIKLHTQKEYLAYDVTSFSTYAKNINDAEFGYNRDGESLPQINLAIYMGQKTQLPLFYVTYPGSIIDKSHLPYMMAYNAELGIENVCFVMDRGFASTANAEFMQAKNYSFILGVEFRLKAIQQVFFENKHRVKCAVNYVLKERVYGLAVRGVFYGIDAVLHMFFDPVVVARQTVDFFQRVAVLESELSQLKVLSVEQVRKYSKYFVIAQSGGGFVFERDNVAVDAVCERLGYFFILTNDVGLSSEEVVSVYRRRDVLEKGFDEVKNGFDLCRLRVHCSETLDGKLFVVFLSLICRLYMQNRLRDFMVQGNFSNDRIVRELSKIRVIEVGGLKRLLNPLTKMQRDILNILDIKPEFIEEYVNTLNL
jgi:transposase